MYFYANYLGDLSHYLLVSWLILAIGLGYCAEMVVRALVGRVGSRAAVVAWAILLVPLVLGVSNFAANDQSANTDGERFTEQVFAALPDDAVLVTYWDALTPLSYKHCVEGVKPGVTLRAYDSKALVTCDPATEPLTELARERPIYALMMFPESLKQQTGLNPVAVGTIRRALRQALPGVQPPAVPAGARRRHALRPSRTPATRCSTWAARRGSSGSGRGSSTGPIRRRLARAATPTRGRPPTCASTASAAGSARRPRASRGRCRSTA